MSAACRTTTRWIFRCLIAAMPATLASCSGGNFDIPASAESRNAPRIAATKPLDARIGIPADEAFNVVHPYSRQEGAGAASASAEPSGKAACRAACADAGSAEAGFQLGYHFEHEADQPVSAWITLSASGECRVSSGDPDVAATISAELWAFVKDSRGNVVHKETLLSGLEGTVQRRLDMRTGFPLTLAPRTGYYIVLAGRVATTAGRQRRADAALDLSSAAIEIKTQPDAAASQPRSVP